jgi:hypothetical protein
LYNPHSKEATYLDLSVEPKEKDNINIFDKVSFTNKK